VLGLTLLAGLSAACVARAEDARQPCDVPPYLLSSESSLPKVAEAVKSGQPLTILVVGSLSSTSLPRKAAPIPRGCKRP
jgi:hypothetical protein